MMSGEAWASVIYLTPNAPVTHGTGLFRDTKTQSVEKTEDLKISMASFKGLCGNKIIGMSLKCILMLGMYITDWLCIQQNIGMLLSTQVGGMIKNPGQTSTSYAFLYENKLMSDNKFNEKEAFNSLHEYIGSTYGKHYSMNKIQSTEFIFDAGHGEGFCSGNIIKYAQRYGKKMEES